MSNLTLTNADAQILGQVGIETAKPRIALFKAWTVDASDDAARENDVVKVETNAAHPDATAWNESSNNYGTDDSTTTEWKDVTLNTRKKTTFAIKDEEWGKVNLEQKSANAVNGLLKQVFEDVAALITNANFGAAAFTGAASTFDSDDMADLRGVATAANYTSDGFAVLSSAYYTNLLKDNDVKLALNIGTSSVVQDAVFPNVAGFSIIQSTIIPANGENLVGFITDGNGIAMASRVIEPMGPAAQGDVIFEKVTDPESGYTFGIRIHYDRSKGLTFFNFESLYGFSLVDATRLDRMVSA